MTRPWRHLSSPLALHLVERNLIIILMLATSTVAHGQELKEPEGIVPAEAYMTLDEWNAAHVGQALKEPEGLMPTETYMTLDDWNAAHVAHVAAEEKK